MAEEEKGKTQVRKWEPTKESKELARAIDEVLRTDAGRTLFVFLHDICGYNKSEFTLNPVTREINPLASLYNAAQRGVYVRLRNLASYDLLKVAEELAETRGQAPQTDPKTTAATATNNIEEKK